MLILLFLLILLSAITIELSKDLTSGPSTVLWPKMNLLRQKCVFLHQKLKNLIPTLKSRVHEFTDGGTGVNFNNHDVKFRHAEISLTCDLDYPTLKSKLYIQVIQNYIQDFCDSFIVEKHLLLKYLNHLRYLKINQEKKNFGKNKIKNCSVSIIGNSRLIAER